MPYPAVNLNGYLDGPFSVTDTGSPPFWATAGYMRVVKSHPASISNPIGPDGTRAMSPWRHYGGRWRNPSNTEGRQWLTAWGPDVFQRVLSGCSPTADIDPGSLQVWDGGHDTSRLRALASWSDRQVEYSAALAQAGQTARMVGDLGKGFASQIEKALSKKGPQNAKNWKKIPSWYLEYLYGWQPLMDDIDNITDKLVKSVDMGETMHVMLKGRWKGRGEKVVTNSFGSSWGSQYTVESTMQLEQKNTSVFKYMFPSDRLPNLEPTAFFGTTWELAPYSFVLDKVLPVGTWLNALDANALACYFVEGSSSEMVRVLNFSKQEHVGGESGWTVEMRRFETVLQSRPWNFTRVLENPWSITSRVPFRADLNLSHAAQGMALLSQALIRLGG